jgi:hypothetical protein
VNGRAKSELGPRKCFNFAELEILGEEVSGNRRRLCFFVVVRSDGASDFLPPRAPSL